MKRNLINYLKCLKCSGIFTLSVNEEIDGEIKEGELICKKCNTKYPISHFIPRFVESDGYVDNFSFEWRIHKKTQLDTEDKKESKKSFFQKLGFKKEDLKDKLVLDVGCGMGRYADVALKEGAEVIGIDMSFSVDSARENLSYYKNVHFIQADIFHLPFRENIFDVIFSIGVLHHTPNTEKAFNCLVPFLKKWGMIGIWVYSNYNRIHSTSSDILRFFTTKIPKRLLYYFSYLSVPLYYIYKIPILGHILRNIFSISMRKEVKWRILDTFDWYSPKYQWKHKYPEVFQWFVKNDLSVIHLGEHPLGITGKKK